MPKMKNKKFINEMIDIVMSNNPKDLKEELIKRTLDDPNFFRKVIETQQETVEFTNENNEVKTLTEEIKKMLNEIISDNLIKVDIDFFTRTGEDNLKITQATEACYHMIQNLNLEKSNYKKIFRSINEHYSDLYEILCKHFFRYFVYRIKGEKDYSNTKIISILSNYNEGKYKYIYSCLIPQIRNSINHMDFIIDHKEPKITFNDKNKPPLTLTLEEYIKLFEKIFICFLSWGSATFEIKKPILLDLEKKIRKSIS